MINIVKLLLLFGLIASITTIALTDTRIWGERISGDKLVHDQNITLPKKIALVQTTTVNYSVSKINKKILNPRNILNNFIIF